MSTTLDIKKDVTTQLGKTTYASVDIVRDEAIKRARRKFYKEYKWSFNKKSTTIIFLNGVAAWPTDYEDTFEPSIFSFSGTLKTKYRPKRLEDVSGYTSDFTVFGIDYSNKQFTTNLDGTVEIEYQIRPQVDLTDDYVEPADDISAISACATALFWLAKERNQEMFSMFMAVYKDELARLIREDRLKEPVRRFKSEYNNEGYGDIDA